MLLPVMMLASNVGPIDDIATAFKKGDASAIAKFMDAKVNVTILDKKDSYSRSQAEQVLKGFFSKNRPSSFTVSHDGNSPGGDQFFIGNMRAGVQTYRVYIYLKKSGTSFTIRELRIEKP